MLGDWIPIVFLVMYWSGRVQWVYLGLCYVRYLQIESFWDNVRHVYISMQA